MICKVGLQKRGGLISLRTTMYSKQKECALDTEIQLSQSLMLLHSSFCVTFPGLQELKLTVRSLNPHENTILKPVPWDRLKELIEWWPSHMSNVHWPNLVVTLLNRHSPCFAESKTDHVDEMMKSNLDED